MIIISNVTLLILHDSGRKRPERRNASDRSARMPSHHRVCFRRAATLGVDWATAHGRVLLRMDSESA